MTWPVNQMGIRDFSVEPEITRFREDKEVELRADTHPSVIFVQYKSILPEVSDYLLPMADQFLYYQENRMTFDTLISRMEELLQRVRSLG